MRKLIVFICFLSVCSLAKSQDTVKVVTAGEFYEHQQIRISYGEGWAFKKGHNPDWASVGITTNDWDTLQPSDLTAALADENGRLEGWFRLRIMLDSSFGDMQVGIIQKVWAATDIYLDGDSIFSFGNTGLNGGLYKEYKPDLTKSYSIPINDGKVHVLAIHFVDYVAPPFWKLKSENMTHVFLNLTGPDFTYNILQSQKSTARASGSIFTGTVILSLIFWFFYFQNKQEKNLLFIAITVSIYCFFPMESLFLPAGGASYYLQTFLSYLNMFGVSGIIISVPLTCAKIMNNKVNRLHWMLSGLLFLYFQFIFFTDIQMDSYSLPIFIVMSVLLCFYYLYAGWNDLKGPKWALAGGLLATLGFMILLIVYLIIGFAMGGLGNLNLTVLNIIMVLLIISLPIGLLIYVFMWVVYMNKNVEQKALDVVRITEEKKEILTKQNILLEEQVTERTKALNQSLDNLKSTQTQLIHSEKMASLGELTAGIAHEIQNPLNFVNNFSEVNKEMLEELREAVAKNDQEEIEIIIKDLLENENKVMHHGKRAEGIVKSMLQHSRTSSGEKELTDINVLCDEYIRLAYHGFRAKDKSLPGRQAGFNAEFKTDLDPNLPKINVVPQDIGRVILNLVNNAFQAVSEKATLPARPAGGREPQGDNYSPEVIISTRVLPLEGDKGGGASSIQITVTDNGPGIPDEIKDKIFQPFFTTKPTGQGTGLGLSMSYEIVTKGHGGELRVETKVDEGSTFIIQLQLNS